jgi:hypothetical protein
MSDEPQFDAAKGTLAVGGSRLVLHCHHYNVFLQRSVEDALDTEGVEIQKQAAAEAAQRALSPLFERDGGASLAQRLSRAASFFGANGFGLADTGDLTADGGTVELPHSHYALGWREKWNAPSEPVCHFAVGFWKGALCAAAGLDLSRVRAEEQRCAAVSEGPCVLRLEVS